MAAIDFHTPVSVFSALGHRAMHFPAQLARSVLAWHRARQTRQDLMMLTDRQLSDIGLTREMVAEMKVDPKDS